MNDFSTGGFFPKRSAFDVPISDIDYTVKSQGIIFWLLCSPTDLICFIMKIDDTLTPRLNKLDPG